MEETSSVHKRRRKRTADAGFLRADPERWCEKTVDPILAPMVQPMLMKSAAAEDAAVVSAFLNRMSIEITAKQAEKLPLIAAKVGANRVEMAWLENSYHVATIDNDKALIAKLAIDFIKSIAGR